MATTPPPLHPTIPPPRGAPDGLPPLDYVRVGPDQLRNTPATAGLVCGVLLFIPYVAGIAAILLGRAGQRRADEIGGRGRRVANAAVVLGVINLVLAVFFTAALVPARGLARQRAMQTQCASNLRQLSMAMMMYAEDHRGDVPLNLDAIQRYLGAGGGVAAVCTCPDASAHALPPASTGFGTKYSYVYVIPAVPRLAQIRNPASVPAAYEPLTNHAGRGINVVYWDGHVEWHSTAAAQKLIAQIQATQSALPQATTTPAAATATVTPAPPADEPSPE